MTTPLTPAELIKDIKALDRSIANWNVEGRLDWDTDKYLKDRRAELMEELREGFTTGKTKAFDDWYAFEGIDAGREMPIGYGPTEFEAIVKVFEMLGEDA